ncbi:MAG: sugar-transfer associated ATP-grasp domain-containing protein [Balneolaceae bacterium]|nr:sugar-transfer associated ATP-grasp domain-containing protein [Balneolaceae bacterium]
MLNNPSNITVKIFEPLQSYILKNKLHRSYKSLPLKSDINQAYSKEVKLYWRNKLDIYINPVWHHIFSTLSQNFDPRYITHGIWWKYFQKSLNPSVYQEPLISDKNFLDSYIGKQYLPQTVFKVVNGRFFNKKNQLIDKNTAKAMLFDDQTKKFAKPSTLFQGKGACKLTLRDDNVIIQDKPYSFDEFISRMGINFIVQYTIEQHPKIAEVHPNSVNTLRIFTVRLYDEVHFINGAIKFGADNNDADNTGNGVLCSIDRHSFELCDIAFNRRLETFTRHMNTGIEFKNFGKVPHYQEAIALCKEAHKNLFYHDFAAWDIAITKNGTPLIVELNTKPSVFMWQIQFREPFFNDLTDEVIAYISRK